MATQGDSSSDLVETLMAVSHTFTSIVIASMIDTDETITPPQLRVLMALTAVGSTNMSGLAADLGVDASTASRACEQLVRRRLVSRTQDPADRRHVELGLTKNGVALVGRLLTRRRELFSDMAQRLPAEDQAQLARGLELFSGTARRTLDTARLESEQKADPSARRQAEA